MTLPPTHDPEFVRKRRGRNIALALTLFALVALFYGLTLVRMGKA